METSSLLHLHVIMRGGGVESIKIPNVPVADNVTFAFISASNGEFTYQVTPGAPNTIERMAFEFFIDCNLIPVVSGTFSLRQTYLINGTPIGIINGLPASPSNQIISVLHYPRLVALPMTAPVPGNFGQTDIDMIFTYQNTGSSSLNMNFDFNDLSACAGSGYNITEVMFTTTSQGSSNYANYDDSSPFINSIELQPGEILFIKQVIDIVGCVNTCAPRNVELIWYCADVPDPNCEPCQPSLNTSFNFVFETPTYEITRTAPSLLDASFDPTCPMDGLEWVVQVKNTSYFTVLETVNILVEQTLSNTFSIISSNFLGDSDLSNCSTCTNTNTLQALVMSTGQVPCSTAISNQVTSFSHIIHDLGPQEFISFTFKTFRCCDENSLFLNQEKLFNHWAVTATAESACTTYIEPVLAQANPISIASNDVISLHHTTFDHDLNLTAGIVPTISNIVIGPDVLPDPNCDYARFSTYENTYSVRLSGLVGDNNDLQLFGYQPGNPGLPVKMILRVKVSCELGLLIKDETSVYISSLLPNQTEIWNQIPSTFHTTNPDNCCLANSDYYFYFDISSLSGSSISMIHDFFNWGQLSFDFQGCCPALATTPYTVEFSVLMKDDCYGFTTQGSGYIPNCNSGNCCWLPLSSTGYVVHVQCPGCKSPGAVIDHYEINRISLGLEDADNDGLADVPQKIIDPTNYTPIAAVNRKSAVYRDTIQDIMVGHFQAGDNTNGGYTYTSMMTGNLMTFNALQLHKQIAVYDNSQPSSLPPVELRVLGFEFYIDAPVTGGTCEDCNQFPQALTNYTTVLKIIITNNHPLFSNFYEDDGNNTQMLFTIHNNDINALSASYQNTNIWYYNGLSVFPGYLENQQYRMRVNYEVCGNFQPANPAFTASVTEIKRMTEINNTLFFNGDGIDLTTYNTNAPPAPNTISQLHDQCLEFSTHPCPTNPPPTNCNSCQETDQFNLANPFIFYCEKFAGSINIHSTSNYNLTYYNSPASATDCIKEVEMRGVTKFENRSTQTLFPFEYKPPAIFPFVFEFDVPTNDFLIPNSGTNPMTLQSEIKYFNTQGQLSGFNQSQSVTYAVNGNTISLDLNGSSYGLACALENTTFGNSGTTSLLNGDELSTQIVKFYLKPKDCELEVGNNGVNITHYPVSDARITFHENDKGCLANNVACDLEDVRNNDHFVRFFESSNPNLQITLDDNGVASGTSNQVCWGFTINNPNTPGNTVLTPATNVYLAIPLDDYPDLSNYFTDWEVNFNVTQSATSSPVAGSSTMSTNGIFDLAETLNLNYAANITGELCATYTCSGSYSFDLNWGWNCDGFPDEINQNVCEVNTVQLEVVDAPVNLEPAPQFTGNPTQYNLCSNLAISACFSSQELGTVTPQIVSLAGMPASGLTFNGNTVQLRSCDGTLTATNALSPVSANAWTIDPQQLFEIGIGDGTTGMMEINDCFCVDFSFDTECGYDGILPTVSVDAQSYCPSAIPNVTANFNLLPINYSGTSACTDCFTVTKSSNAGSIMAGVSPVTWTIEVCSYNDPGNYTVPVTLTDFYPTGFDWISGDIDDTGGPLVIYLNAPGCTTLTVTGYMNNVGPYFCNIVDLEYQDSQSNTMITSAQACVEVIDNCNDQASQVVMTGTTYAGSFGSGSPVTVPGTTVVINEKLVVDVPWLLFQNQTLIMGPGAEIEVQSGNLLVMDNCTVYACDQMWLGVTMQQDANILILRSTVSDAHRTILVGDRNKVVLIGSTFTDNFITVDAFSKSILNNGTVYYIAENIFEGTGSLKPKYPDQLLQLPELLPEITVSQFDDYPLAAIALAHSNIDFNTPYQGTGFNHFRNMSNGIINYKTKMNVEFCKFENIQPAALYSGGTLSTNTVSFNGSAIFTFAHKSNAQLTQKGHFIGQTGVPSFIDCRYGIFADRCKVVSEHNIMKGMTNAYRVQLNKHDIFIRHNNIDSHRDAIQLLLNDGSPNVVVYDNDIVFGNSDAGQNYCGIRVNEFHIPANNSRINYNRINFRPGNTAATTGIFTSATNGWVITNNEIEMDDNRYNLDGIFMMDNERTVASCNIVTGNGDYDVIQQSAIRVLMGDDYMIGCNTLDKTQNGVFIQSPMQNLTIQGNNFNEHFNAFRYGANAVTNDQDFLGNIWNDQTPPAGGLLALNEYQLWNPFNTNEVGPGTNTYPNNTYQNPQDWFKSDIGDNFQCEDSVTVYCNDFPIDMGRTYSDFEMLIAGDSIVNDPYTDESRWMLRKKLYEKLEENPAWLSDSVLFSFYWNMMYSPTATLRTVDMNKKQLYMTDSMTVVQTELNHYLTWLYNGMAMAKVAEALDSVLANHYPATTLYETGLLQQTLTALQITGDSLMMVTEAQRNAIADVALGNNSSVFASKDIENYEKLVNEIYLSTIGKGIYTFTPPQVQTIFFMAHLCPLAGGAAVSRARSLYSLVNPYEKYDDKTVCFEAGIAIRQQKAEHKIPAFLLYPNPARTSATLEYELPTQTTGEFVVLDISGRPLMSHHLHGGKAKFEFATETMKPGIYFYLVRSQRMNVHTGKLIIVQ